VILSRGIALLQAHTLRAILRNAVLRFLNGAKRLTAPNSRRETIAVHRILHGEASSDAIGRLLLEDQPKVISRLGTTEMRGLSRRMTRSQRSKVALDLSNLSGVYPPTSETVSRFRHIYTNWIHEIDVLAVRDLPAESVFWRREASVVKRFFKGTTLVSIEDLFPLEHAHPWTRLLENKRVLVVHPFESSIRFQSSRLDRLYTNRFLPQMEIEVLQPPQLLADSSERDAYVDWFEAFASAATRLEEKILTFQPDVVLIGAGALGLGLAVVAKKRGVSAIHIGGALQLFFGIRGKRWESDQRLQQLVVDKNWIHPEAKETPQGFSKVEGGCYW
jgi:hypothetical protein